MKKILKSLLVLALVMVATVSATRAYFTSTVTAQNNEIEAGTLLVGLATTEYTEESGPAYVLAYDQLLEDGDVQNNLANFPALENLAPGDTEDVYLAVYNRGSLLLNYRMTWDGSWTDLPNYGGPASNGNKDLVYVYQVKRYKTDVWDSGEYGPYNLHNWLEGYTYDWDDSQTEKTWTYGGGLGWNTAWNDGQELDENEYAVYKVTFKLDESTGNNYQGGTFEYEVVLDARQPGGSW